MAGISFDGRTMTRHEMSQCRILKAELKSIEKAMQNPKPTEVTVFYKDYRTGKGIPKSLEGLDAGEEHLRELKAYYRNKRRSLLRRIKQAEEFIDSIEDSEMRTILRMYYITGCSQQEIGDELGYTAARINQKLSKFWDTHKRSRSGKSRRRAK